MTLRRTAISLAVAFVATAVLASAPAVAFIGECMVAVSKQQRQDLADKTELDLKDSVEHRDIHFTLRGKTFGELQPGDVVDAHGEPHMLHQVTHRVGWSQYTFIKQSDLDAHAARLASGGGGDRSRESDRPDARR